MWVRLPHYLLISRVVNLPLHIEEDEDKSSLETVEDDEEIPENIHLQDGGEEAEEPGEAHDDG